MKEKEQDKKEALPLISPLAKDATYGEKAYDFIFNNLINFWLNLTVSAAFTFWVSHSLNPIKIPFVKKAFSSPSVLQGKLAKGIHDMPFMSVFKEAKAGEAPQRQRYANNAANIFTLVTAGHFIMIPSVWLGAKIKSKFVEDLNRKHYGDEAMDDPSLKARHAAIRLEERPTLFGAFVGRLGTIFATQFTTYTVGNASNAVKWVGEKGAAIKFGEKTPFKWMGSTLGKFPGLDDYAAKIGNSGGDAVMEIAPEGFKDKMDHKVRNFGPVGYDWSNQQKADPKLKDLVSGEYRNSARHMGKYLAQDVLYTAVTATTIAPAINFLKKYIPGMTYKPKDADAQAYLDAHETPKMRIRSNKIMDGMGGYTTVGGNKPASQVSQVSNTGKLQAPELQVNG